MTFRTQPTMNSNAVNDSWMDYTITSYCLSSQATLLAASIILADDSKIPVSTKPQPATHTPKASWKAKVQGNNLHLSYTSPKDQLAHFKLLDTRGKVILQSTHRVHQGQNELTHSLATIPPGLWIASLQTPTDRKSTTIIH